MIENLKPYPAYKGSGAPWLGQVPEHWEVCRLGHIGRLLKGSGGNKEDEVASGMPCVRYGDLYTTHSYHILQSRSFVTHAKAADYTPIAFGDVLFAASGETIDEIGKSAVNLIQSQARCGGDIIIFRPKRAVDARYMGYATDCRPSATQKATLGRGITVKHIYGDELKRLALALPPLPEQRAITRFLDHTTRLIRRYIRAKQKLIKLLEEQKQAIIHQAVTRGLDPNVRLKPSGVEWLGDVPEGWEVVPLRRRWSVTDCKHLTVPFVEDGIPLASVREVQTFDLALVQAKRTTEPWYETLIEGERKPRRGDLIYCRNVSVGAAAFVGTDERFAMGQDVCLIRSKDQNQRYLNYFLRCPAMARQLALLQIGSTFNRINVADIKGLMVVVPPFEAQDAIANRLDERLESINNATEKVHQEITLLRECRARLIADVVTGKLDVRGWVAPAGELEMEEDESELDAGEAVEEGEFDEEVEEVEV